MNKNSFEKENGAMTAKPMLLSDFSARAGISVGDVVLVLLQWGVVCAKNQTIQKDMVIRLANHFGVPIVEGEAQGAMLEKITQEVSVAEAVSRQPIVAVVGHVDHGKTSLLDFIRESRVAAGEAGGITQHIGAYEVKGDQGSVTFLDTPGHAAFSRIRERGVHFADIAILVVAADDGVMEQTVEAINYIKHAGLPVVVAVNKMDKAEPGRVDVIKQQLAQYGLVSEDWGGEAIVVPISAKTGEGVPDLLELVFLQGQMLELKAEPDTFPGRGYVLEAQLERGRGAVATIIGQHGALSVGDYLLSGGVTGKISRMVDSYGKHIFTALPAVPVRVSSFDELPEVGGIVRVVSKSDYLRARSGRLVGLDDGLGLHKTESASESEGKVALIVRVDTMSSREAVVSAINKLSRERGVSVFVVNSGVGEVTEGDIDLAEGTGAVVVTFHAKASSRVRSYAHHKGVEILSHSVIYKLLDDLLGRFSAREKEEQSLCQVGSAQVIQVFPIKKTGGIVAGSRVLSGKIVQGGTVIAFRNDVEVGKGIVSSLQKERSSVKEVGVGSECGIVTKEFQGWQVGDVVHCYTVEKSKK